MNHKINLLVFTLYFSALYKGAGQFIPVLETNGSIINLFIDLIIILLGFTCMFNASKKTIRSFFIILILSTFTFFLNSNNTLVEHLNGLREVLVIFMLLIIFSSLVNTDNLELFTEKFRKFAKILLVLQLPMVEIQDMQYYGGDRIGGTFGLYGGSGILTLTIFLLVYFLIEDKGSNRSLLAKGKQLILLSVFFVPIFLNETKISFLLIPLMAITFISLKQLGSSIILLVLAAAFFFLFSSLYNEKASDVQGGEFKNPITEIFSKDYLDSYLNGDVIVYEDIPRLTKIQIGMVSFSNDYKKLFLGQEYGAFKGGTTIKHSSFSDKYQWLLEGTIPYFFFLLISGGLSLIFLVIYSLYGEIYAKFPEGYTKYSKGLLFFLSALFILILFYNDAFRNQTFLIIYIYLIYYARYNQPFFSDETSIES